MHSNLRIQTAFEPISAHTTAASYPHSTSPRPEKRQRMGIASTYRLAHRARGKLSGEAARGDHDLRLLVGHANLLDSLMLELQDAERDQHAWFNQSVKAPAAAPAPTPAPVAVAAAAEEARRVQWSDSLVEEHRLDVPDASDDEEEDEDAESSDDDEDVHDLPAAAAPSQPIAVPRRHPQHQAVQRRSRSPPAAARHVYADDAADDSDEDMESDDEYDDLSLKLTRTRSHSGAEVDMAVPELVHDASDESDDESGPSSPDRMDLDAQQVIVKDFAAAAVAAGRSRPQKHTQRMLDEALDAIMEVDEESFMQQAPQQRPNRMVAAY